jgi:hypothetical protein
MHELAICASYAVCFALCPSLSTVCCSKYISPLLVTLSCPGTDNWQTPEELLVEGLLSAPDANKQQRQHPVVLQQLLQELPLPRKMPIHFQVGSAGHTCAL